MKHCKDCEPAQEIHALAYISVVLDYIDGPFFNMMDRIFKTTVDTVADMLALPFFNLMVFLRLAHFSDAPDEKDNYRTRCFWEEAKRRGIEMKEFHMGPLRDVFVAKYTLNENGKTKVLTFSGLPRPGTAASPALRWMDNKGTMNKKFKKENIPVANGGVAWNKKKAIHIYERVEKPVITKPNLGSRSRHTTIHIDTREAVIAGFRKAKKLSPLVVIEEELRGDLYRGTLVDGKLVGVVRRDQPEVKGDGIHTLQALWEEENKRPERSGPIFHAIVFDERAEAELKRQNIKMEDIPEAERVIKFSQKTSRGSGGTTTEVTEITHLENIKMLEHIASFLNDPLIGVDFIMEDITMAWQEQKRSGVIECNSLPFIDLHHYPLFGTAKNIAGHLWDMVLPESKIK